MGRKVYLILAFLFLTVVSTVSAFSVFGICLWNCETEDIIINPQTKITKYGSNSFTTIQGGKVNTIIYSGTTFIEEGDDWVKVEESNSLKGSKIGCIIEKDNLGDPEAICEDFNITNIIINNISYAKTNKMPIKVFYDGELEYEGTIDLNKFKNFHFKIPENLLDNKSIFKYEIHLGENSTTIKIQDSSEIEDLYLFRGTSATDRHYITLYKGNITQIVQGGDIENADFCMYYYRLDDTGTLDHDITYGRVDNQTWTESDSVANLFNMWNDTKYNETTVTPRWQTEGSWDCINITNQLEYEYNKNNSFLTVYFFDPDFQQVINPSAFTYDETWIRYGDGYNGKRKNFYSSDYGVASLRPYLNITYNPPPVAPTITVNEPTNDSMYSKIYINLTYNDANGDNGNISIINASNNIVICTNLSIASGGIILCNHNTESPNEFKWYYNVTDGVFSTTSGTYNFTMTNFPPTTPTSITCNGGTCNATFYGTVLYECSGSTDAEGDTITYSIEIINETPSSTSEEVHVQSFTIGVDLNPVTSLNWSTSYEVDSGCVWWKDSDGTASSSTGVCGGSSNCAGDDGGYDDNEYAYVETSSGQCNTGTGHAFLNYSGVDMDTYPYMRVFFAYNMYGSDMGRLSFEIDDGAGGWDELWNESGDQGTSWFYTNVTLEGYSGMRNIRFNYDRNGFTSFHGDVAVDVINLTNMPTGTGNWLDTGNHTDGNTLNYTITVNETYVSIRSRAIDLGGSGSWSSYFTETVNLTLITGAGGEAPSYNCTCSGLNVNKVYDYSLNCQINDDCNMGSGNISWTGTGNWYCNATIIIGNMQDPTSSVWVQQDCNMTIG